MSSELIKKAHRHESAGEIDQALEAYRSIAADSPAYAESRIRVVGILLMRGQVDEAEREARGFVERKPDSPDAYATLGQVLRLRFRFDEAIGAFQVAAQKAPHVPGLRAFLNDAYRARYWAPDADLYAALRLHAMEGRATPDALYRFFHCVFVGLLNPELQTWLSDADAEPALPDRLKRALDERFNGRFSQELEEAAKLWRQTRAAVSPNAPARARVRLSTGETLEGALEDGDTVIGAALEAVKSDEYVLIPFGEIASIQFGPAGPYVKADVRLRTGAVRHAEVPALYFFTEGCRRLPVREGRVTAWRQLTKELRVGLGLRDFLLTAAEGPTLLGIDRVSRIEFVG